MLDAQELLIAGPRKSAIPLAVIAAAQWGNAYKKLSKQHQIWAKAQGFEAAPQSILMLASEEGALQRILIGAPRGEDDAFSLGAVASKLPAGLYGFETDLPQPELTALAWCLELYRFDPHRPVTAKKVQLVCSKGVERKKLIHLANTCFAVRDQVNMPANLFGPDELEKAALGLAKKYGAQAKVIKGKVLAAQFPLINIVGLASTRQPRLIDFTWGNPKHPKVTLVGKGVCFDTGGLDIKPSAGMLLMKKDMGGAANVLGLAGLIMENHLKVRLRVLVPAVENSIAGAAFRPGDVFKSRKGLTVEIGNTDAEGRLILADALALADEEAPALLIDMATLTGAARVALGPDLPPFYTDDEGVASALARHAGLCNDPLWRLPLWRPYASMIDTPLADLNNSGQGGFAGSITAALFLRRFVEKASAHVHFDIFAWTPNAKPGRPRGGEQQAMRALYSYLSERFST